MFNSIISTNFDVIGALVCFLTAIILGLIISYTHMKTSKYTKNFAITLALLPLLVCVVIIMVNGNLGTGIAVAGAFSLIGFRSVPGNSKEITSVFFSMAIGLSLGVGYIGYAVLITLLGSVFIYFLVNSNFAKVDQSKLLRILIPEELDYTEEFKEVFNKYTDSAVLEKVKTTNLGSLFELTYRVNIFGNEKKFLDDLRYRNGNLKISLEKDIENESEL